MQHIQNGPKNAGQTGSQGGMVHGAAKAAWGGLAGAALLLLSACGGGGGDEAAQASAQGTDMATAAAVKTTKTTKNTQTNTQTGTQPQALPSRAEAYRLLTQASFGATEADLSKVSAQGVDAWITEQLALPVQAVHLPRWQATTRSLKAKDPAATAGTAEVVHSFYQAALLSPDQLRHRTAFALSQIFVISLNDLGGERGEAAASFQDMLARNAFGNFRTLLEDVAKHPAMGIYLSHLKNRKADNFGRQPDQNFAREIMQLFSIGLHQLNADGTPRLDALGQPIDTYGSADIEGLAAVFTGYSFSGPDTSNNRFWNQEGYRAADRYAQPMQGYPQFHTTTAKSFLGKTIAAQGVADPAASLSVAVDTLFQHPNVGPFIGRQLIQRLVTSHPSPAYVARVASVFNNNGLGVRGDMKAVVRAVLTDTEARTASLALAPAYGKIKEPVLRLTAFLRAFNAKSDSGKVLMTSTEDPATALGQSPYAAPSVFNFYRPGYVPAGGEAASLGLTLPEMQITSESSVAGYANFMMNAIARGVGPKGVDWTGTRPDLQLDYTSAVALADRPSELVNHVLGRLMPEVPATLATEITNTVSTIAIPRATGRNAQAVNNAKLNRVYSSILLAMVSPEFLVQK